VLIAYLNREQTCDDDVEEADNVDLIAALTLRVVNERAVGRRVATRESMMKRINGGSRISIRRATNVRLVQTPRLLISACVNKMNALLFHCDATFF
jgi:hypothetical protein